VNVIRLVALAAVTLAVAAGNASGATRFTDTFAGPKTWLQGWDAGGTYDTPPGFQWWYTEMTPSCWCRALVTFIDTSGNWHETWSYPSTLVSTFAPQELGLRLKPYCKNNSPNVYTAACTVLTYS
jgi:hypothetical protein